MTRVTSSKVLNEGQLFDYVNINQTKLQNVLYLNISERTRPSASGSGVKEEFYTSDTKCADGFHCTAEHGGFIMKVPAYPDL